MPGVRKLDQSGAGSPNADLTSGPDLILLAPLDGWASPLGEVPDPVFADKMMGDGLAIDPTGSVLSAPCDGEIVLLHAAHHAVTLRAANGAEILMHIGLDTVALGGQGFTPHVTKGQKVRAGERLISFDLDQLARSARSLITPIIITNGEDFAIAQRLENAGVARGQNLMTLRRLSPLPASAAGAGREFRRELVVPLAHGLHARPAASLANLAKNFAAEIAILSGDRRANARSPVALMGLGLAKGAVVTAIAKGADAEEALAAIAGLIESGMGEATATQIEAPLRMERAQAGMLTGVRAAPGLGLGVAVRLTQPEIAVEEMGQGYRHESQSLQGAIAMVKVKLGAAAGQNAAQSAILAAHLSFLDDPELASHAEAKIGEGKSAGYAWRDAIQMQVAVLQGLKDPRFAERVSDLVDLEHQVLGALGGPQAAPPRDLPASAILLAEDILPSQLIGLDTARLAGIAMAAGGPTSHAAILAASMNIPALVACGPALLAIPDGTFLLLDADHGRLTVDPSVESQEQSRRQIAERHTARVLAQAKAHELCHTKDGVRIEIGANLGSIHDAAEAVAAGAESCGLLRTEFLFLDRQSPPSEAEQAEVYRAIGETLAGRPLIVRTLDIGGDKPAAYLPFPAEENPALGLRGVRVSLWRPELLTVQLRAILRGIPAAHCRIMLPMIASLSELRQVRAILDRVRGDLGIADKIALGVMVETPAAAMTADILAAEADFLSIGTNDLTQYCLAMDRGNAALASQFDALHPAVLRLIAATTQGADLHDRRTGVCGGLASDPAAAPILIGLGVRGLSATASQIADLKAVVGRMTLEQCRRLAQKALAATSAAEVRELTLSMGDS
jgi:phosphocarrier protein FPr/phosphocarrier protein